LGTDPGAQLALDAAVFVVLGGDEKIRPEAQKILLEIEPFLVPMGDHHLVDHP